jgi:hypothetical protein
MVTMSHERRILSCTPLRRNTSTELSHSSDPVSCSATSTSFGARWSLATKVGAIVAGQTSVKAPERAAFEQYLPDDVHIVSCHSLHGPTVPPKGQPLVHMLTIHQGELYLPSLGPDQT